MSTLLNSDFVLLVLTKNCNMSCSYCYQKNHHHSEVLSIDSIINNLKKLNNSVEICIFGGEPFLKIDLMKQIIEWGSEYKNFKFQIVTNGQIINREFFKDYCKNIDVLVSIDGPEHIHDLNRGKGSWKKVMEFYNVFYEETNKYPFLMETYYKNTLSSVFESIKCLFNLPRIRNNFIISFANQFEYSMEDIGVFKEEFSKVREWYFNQEIYKTTWQIHHFKLAEQKYLSREERMSLGLSMIDTRESCVNHNPAIYNDIFTAGRIEIFDNVDKYIRIFEDFDNFSYLTLDMKNFYPCSECEKLGCKFKYDYWFREILHELDDTFCKLYKIIIEESKIYVNQLKSKLHI